MTVTTLHDVLLRPVISEKSTLETERNNYTFAVARDANKFLIKAACARSRSGAAGGRWAWCPAGRRPW
jgi:hypothetical protein